MFAVRPPPVVAPAPVAEYAIAVVWTPETGEALARKKAGEYGIDEHTFVETMRCESKDFIDPGIQSEWYKDGVRENSWGYAQFNLPSGLITADGRTVTYEIAVDPEEALDAAAFNFSINNAHHWSCFKKR